jgi:nucleoside 2-deoxyribosyltransferase
MQGMKSSPRKPSKSAKPASPALSVYFAAPLFTLLERRANRTLAKALKLALPELELILPQDIKYEGKYNDARSFGFLFQACLDGLDRSAAVIAWLDGPDADSGASFEVGYAFARHIPVIGVRTDFRQNQEKGMNIMLSRACAAIVYRPSFDEDFDALARAIAQALKKVTPPQDA